MFRSRDGPLVSCALAAVRTPRPSRLHVAVLAREGVVTYPAAMVLARAAYEGAIRVLWMLKPDDPFDRESRWLVNLRQTARFHEQVGREFESLGFEDDVVVDRRSVAATIRKVADGVTAKLPPGIEPTATLPSLKDMVEELDMPERYVPYRLGSQFTHVAGYATGIYRRNLGTSAVVGEFLEADQWIALSTWRGGAFRCLLAACFFS